MSPEELISRYGYLALFAGVVLEGETVLIAASFAAHQGYLSLPWVIVAAFLGSIGGDGFYFFLGRVRGRKFLRNRPLWQRRVSKAGSLLERHNTLAILGFRFVYGLRSVAPFAIGMSGVGPGRFLLLNAVSGLTWAALIGAFGFLFGTILEHLLLDVGLHERLILVAILAVGIAAWVIRFLRKMMLRRAKRPDSAF